MAISSTQNKKLHALLTKKGLMDNKEDKEEVILGATNGRTAHSSEMTEEECNWLIMHLQQMESKDSANQMRRKIISKYREMGYNLNGKADMKRIEAAVQEKWGKKLNDYTSPELTKIISVLEENILPWYYNQLRNGNN